MLILFLSYFITTVQISEFKTNPWNSDAAPEIIWPPIVVHKLETLKKDIGFTARACWQAMKEIIKQTP